MGIDNGRKPGPLEDREPSPDGFLGTEIDSTDDRDEPNQGGFAEQGRGAPEGSEPDSPPQRSDVDAVGPGDQRTANAASNIEGNSSTSG